MVDSPWQEFETNTNNTMVYGLSTMDFLNK
jgi:hypothetical protein